MLTENDKEILRSWGHDESDISQIERVAGKRFTKYSREGRQITREKAIEILGRRSYLAGLSRSAFHYTASQVAEGGEIVLFDSSAFFKEATPTI